MKAILITMIMALPCFVFGQNKVDDYAIYSNYLKSLQTGYDKKLTYVVRISSDYGRKYGEADIGETLEELRDYVKGDKTVGGVFIQCAFFRDTLQKDTLWLPLISRLNKSIQKEYVIKNKFSKDLEISMLPYIRYVEYFVKDSYMDVEEGWATFHEDYPGYSLLINLSEIESDGKRAVFYLSHQCGGLCGEGDIVLFYKDSSGWQFVGTLPIWMS